MIYRFKAGGYYGLDAQKTGEELERIREAEGGILPTQTVVKAAKREGSPLHKAFTWDTQKAAEERWAEQARSLIRALVVVEGEQQRTAFINVSVRTEGEESQVVHYYQATQVLVGRPEEYESALAMSRSRLMAAKNSLDELQSLSSRKQTPRIKRARQHVESAVRELAV